MSLAKHHSEEFLNSTHTHSYLNTCFCINVDSENDKTVIDVKNGDVDKKDKDTEEEEEKKKKEKEEAEKMVGMFEVVSSCLVNILKSKKNQSVRIMSHYNWTRQSHRDTYVNCCDSRKT